MPSIRAKKKVNVYSESSLNMPTNERKITKLLPLPMLHVVRLWITRCLSSPLSLCPFYYNANLPDAWYFAYAEIRYQITLASNLETDIVRRQGCTKIC